MGIETTIGIVIIVGSILAGSAYFISRKIDWLTRDEDKTKSSSPRKLPRLGKNIIFGAIGAVAILIIAANAIAIVDAGHRGILLKFGAVDTTKVYGEGLHFITPFQDKMIQLEVRTLKVEEKATSASKDLQDVQTQVALNYHIDPERAHIVYQNLGPNYNVSIINPAIQESVKQITAQFTAEELVTKRESVKNSIDEQITRRLASYNLIVETISITDFKFSDQFTQAIELKVTAEQKALQAKNDLERIKIEAQQLEAQAVGQQKANIAKAQGEAEAIRIIDEQLKQNPNYLEWLRTQKWDGKLPLVTGDSGIPFIQIPVEGTNSTSQ